MRLTARYSATASIPESRNERNYFYGAALMSLAVYLGTEGPEVVDGNHIPTEVERIVDHLIGRQGFDSCNQGGWNYDLPQGDGDLSLTQFAMAGLSAAVVIDDDADRTLAAVVPFIDNTKHDSGGHRYRGCTGGARHSMSASGLWTYRLAGVEASASNVQSVLTWLRDNYGHEPHSITGMYYYTLWAESKGLLASPRPEGVEGGVYSEDIGGVLDPVADGYPQAERGWYYDFATAIMASQNLDGSWGAASPTPLGPAWSSNAPWVASASRKTTTASVRSRTTALRSSIRSKKTPTATGLATSATTARARPTTAGRTSTSTVSAT